MAYPSVTYNFSNGSVSDADQVDQNFQDLINGLSDGTKDLSMLNGTFAGNLIVSGNTTLGNATGDDVTVTGSLASSIPIKTTNSYDIGSSTLGLRALYFGANSQTVNIKASASMSATWTFTLPVSDGTVNYVLETDGSGVSSWVSKTVLSTTSKTTTYTATSSDDIILCSTSGGAWTLTLPAAASNTGKVYKIIKTTSDVNALTIDGNSSETIAGVATTKLIGQYDSIQIISDGSNWQRVSKNAIAARYTTAAGQSITNDGNFYIIDFGTVVHDTYSCVTTGSSWKFTVPADGAGLYAVSVGVVYDSASWTAGNSANLRVYKNGSASMNLFRYEAPATATLIPQFAGPTARLQLVAGDYIDVRITNNRAGGASTLIADAKFCWIDIVREGEY